ncbi:von Willebrand factor type A [Chloroherpeton thalassium ATCC 35110]|uniref:von Willebrand factor type A n=1 Tax=Chloroherpeton thalassium (strain ATCC 35110 / GB-78) TaxID=517418 RepID=B3QY78_CHLT3|nr:VWA domain-containing protein [Chloroherpeton thalassium]ACF15044.1 von Willebrand factor type A [Chloroherpeton thalassium ATCC 35110]
MRFGYPEHLVYLFFLIPLAVLVVFFLRQRFKALDALGESSLMRQLSLSLNRTKVVWKSVLIFLAIAAVLVAYAAPQVGERLKEVKRKGIEVVIALDVSNSMLADDIQPSRLQKSKYTISNFLERLGNDRVGLVVFAGQSFVQCPITSDKSALKLFMDIVSTDAIPTQGTNFSSAIRESIRALERIEEGAEAEEKNRVRNKVILIFSDGEDHEAGIDEVLEEAASKNIRIYTVGVGSAEPTPIPVLNKDGKRVDFKRDSQGSVVTTHLQEALLRKIAEQTKGNYYRIAPQGSDFELIADDINKLEKQELSAKEILDYDDKFQYFVGLALIFLVLESLLTDKRKTRDS